MILTRERQETMLQNYIDKGHTTEECSGFIDGMDAVIKEMNKKAATVCDIEKGTRCKDSFPDYKDGKCRICGGQAN